MKRTKSMVLLVAVLIFFGLFLGNYGNYQLSAIPGSVYEAFHLTDAQFSSLMTAPMLPSILFSIILGILVDRYGISKMVAICFVVAMGGFILRVFAADYTTMLIAMALTGLGCTILNSNLAKIISSLYPMEKVGTIVGIMMAGSTGSMAVAYATTAMFPTLQAAFWLTAVVSVVIAVLWIVFARERIFQNEDAPAMEAVPVSESLKVCFRSRNIWLAGITLMTLMGAAMVVSNFQVSMLVNVKGLTEAQAGTFGTVLMVGAVLGSVFVPVFVAKAPSRTPLMVLVLGIITAFSMIGMVTLPVAGIYVCSFLNGALRSGVIAVLMSIPVMLKEIGPKYAGTAGGLVVTLELIGAVIIPTYIVVPMGGGQLVSYFYIGTVFMLISTVVGFILMKSCGAYSEK